MKKATERVAPNLYIRTRDNGRRFYVVRWMAQGVACERSLGAVETLTLKQAKAQAGAAILKGKAERKQSTPTFQDIYRQALDDRERLAQWRNPKTSLNKVFTLKTYALPVLGRLRVDAITRDDVLTVLRPIWEAKPVQAEALRSTLSQVFQWCIVHGFRADDVAAWKGNLSLFLPPTAKIHTPEHHAAPGIEDLRKAVQYVREHPSLNGAALLLIIATASRFGEVAQATAEQFIEWLWIVPKDAQKAAEADRRVPLSSLAQEALRMADLSVSGRIFHGIKSASLDGRELQKIMLKACGQRFTLHGIRSTFRGWCAREGVAWDVAERCLSHQVGSAVVRAYLRDDALDARREVLERWVKQF